jgi:hypothetical protein
VSHLTTTKRNIAYVPRSSTKVMSLIPTNYICNCNGIYTTKLRFIFQPFPLIINTYFTFAWETACRSLSTLVTTDAGNGFRSYELESPRTHRILGVFRSSLGVRLLNVSAASIKLIVLSVFSNSKFLLTLFFLLSTTHVAVIIIIIIIIFIIVICYHLYTWYLQIYTWNKICF